MAKQFGLIGYPLKNSFSKDFFGQKFLQLGLTDYSYENFEIEDVSQLNDILSANPNLAGFNVTTPHKQTIIPQLDELDKTAQEVGAVNCVKVVQGSGFKVSGLRLIGCNTDVFGFEKSLLPVILSEAKRSEESVLKLKALILGTGGAAKAVAYVLKKIGIEFEFISGQQIRNPKSEIRNFSFKIQNSKFIINCTPLGMFPNQKECPAIPYHLITPNHFCYDLIYLPAKTLFLKKCEAQGAKTKNGLQMLHLQAEKSWEIWNK